MATRVRVAPITDADVCSVAAFLHAHLNSDISASDWAEAIGDLVVIFQSDACGLTASPTAFLSHPAPLEVLV